MVIRTLSWEELDKVAYSVDPYGYQTAAVAFAVRAGHGDELAHRFLAHLCAQGMVDQPENFGMELAKVMRLREEARG